MAASTKQAQDNYEETAQNESQEHTLWDVDPLTGGVRRGRDPLGGGGAGGGVRWDPLSEGVRWVEKYAESLERFFERLPEFISTFIATLAVFTLGATLRGEWVIILVTALKQLTGHTHPERNVTSQEILALLTQQNLKLSHFSYFFIAAHIVSYSIYFLIGGFLHWYFYMKRRDRAKEWKIQADKWLSPELERHEIMVGTVSLFVTGSFSAFLACYIFNENPSTVYYQFDEYGWWWFFLQFPVVFLYIDYTTYILHRMYHTPWLYKHFHKLHHKYKQPTAFSVTAIHPVEILHVQLTACLPLFTVPVHWLPFYIVVLYNYYHGIIDHSGINFKSQWWQPWQPDADFHDKHHEFFHCNFGFNMDLWDKLHGTNRKINLKYTEETFHGTAPLIDSKKYTEETFQGTAPLIDSKKYTEETFHGTAPLIDSKKYTEETFHGTAPLIDSKKYTEETFQGTAPLIDSKKYTEETFYGTAPLIDSKKSELTYANGDTKKTK